MSKTVSRILIDFLESRGLYDLYGREPGKLSYLDVLDLENELVESLEFVESDDISERISELECDRDYAENESDEYLGTLTDTWESLSEVIDDLEKSYSMSESSLIKKLKSIKDNLGV